MKCSKCNADNPNDSVFCSTCGARIKEETPVEIPAARGQKGNHPQGSLVDKMEDDKIPQKLAFVLERFKTKKALIAGCVAVGAVALVLLVVFVIVNGYGMANNGLYIRDQELFFTDFSGEAPFQITTRMFDVDEEDLDIIFRIGTGRKNKDPYSDMMELKA